jgi:carboxypeptidase family protein
MTTLARWTALTALLAGCGGQGDGAAGPPEPQPRVEVTGTVADTFSRAPLSGVRVVGVDAATESQADGTFRLSVPAGPTGVLLSADGYESASVRLTGQPGARLTVTLRPFRPVVLGCVVDSGLIQATVVDLQGRRTIDRRDGSYVFVRAAGETTLLTGLTWSWRTVDSLTYLVLVKAPTGPVEQASMFVSDVEGYSSQVGCYTQPPPGT